MEVTGQLQAPAALPVKKEPRVGTRKKTGYDPAIVVKNFY
jgi:hypothetical protein